MRRSISILNMLCTAITTCECVCVCVCVCTYVWDFSCVASCKLVVVWAHEWSNSWFMIDRIKNVSFSPIHPGHFPCTMLQQNQQHREGPHPPLPQSLPAPTIRKTVPEHQSSLRQTAQQLFPPRLWEPELRSPHPPLKPHAIPYLLKHGPPPPPLQTSPNLTTPKNKM